MYYSLYLSNSKFFFCLQIFLNAKRNLIYYMKYLIFLNTLSRLWKIIFNRKQWKTFIIFLWKAFIQLCYFIFVGIYFYLEQNICISKHFIFYSLKLIISNFHWLNGCSPCFMRSKINNFKLRNSQNYPMAGLWKFILGLVFKFLNKLNLFNHLVTIKC